MAQEFNAYDFEPLYQQTIVLTNGITDSPNDLSILLFNLTEINSQLSFLITKAKSPNSVLRKLCSDRHGDWLQIQFDLQNTLCEIQDVLDSFAESGSQDVHESEDVASLDRYVKLDLVKNELSTHAYLISEFIDSLGLSKLARKDQALGEIEKILVEAAREEREGNPAGIEEMPEVNRLGGRYGIHELLVEYGVDKEEIVRLDTRIKQVVGWVFRNEPELTLLRDLDYLEWKKDEGASRATSLERVEVQEVGLVQDSSGDEAQEGGSRDPLEVHGEEAAQANQRKGTSFGKGFSSGEAIDFENVHQHLANDGFDDDDDLDEYVWV